MACSARCIDVGIDADSGGSRWHREHAGALGYQVFDADTGGGGVVEDLGGEAV